MRACSLHWAQRFSAFLSLSPPSQSLFRCFLSQLSHFLWGFSSTELYICLCTICLSEFLTEKSKIFFCLPQEKILPPRSRLIYTLLPSLIHSKGPSIEFGDEFCALHRYCWFISVSLIFCYTPAGLKKGSSYQNPKTESHGEGQLERSCGPSKGCSQPIVTQHRKSPAREINTQPLSSPPLISC